MEFGLGKAEKEVKKIALAESYPNTGRLLISRLVDKGFTRHEIKTFIKVLETVCKQCFDGDAGRCHCWRD